jgi:hypothetical protein
MIRKNQFTTKIELEIIKKRVIQYLLEESFKLKSDNGESIIFEKGSVFENHFTFNPRKWKSKVQVTFSRINDKTVVWAKFDIDTIGQKVTLKEEQFWINCVNRLEYAAKGDFKTTQLNSSEGKSTIVNGWKIIGIEIFIILFLIFVAFLIVKVATSIF